jgi:hypothetical protein
MFGSRQLQQGITKAWQQYLVRSISSRSEPLCSSLRQHNAQ